MIVSEDNGPALGCYDEPHVRTPILDQLAAEGVRFTRAFVTQAGCSPSRASFLTGLYPHQSGQIGLATWRFAMYSENTPNAARSLKAAGYRTGIIGKLHVNPENAFPFDFAEIPSSNFGRKNLSQYAEAASSFFEQSDEPFFLSINYPDAHRPFLRQAEGRPEKPLKREGIKPLPYIGLDSPRLRNDTAGYYDCMERLDGLVGDLLARLEASGKAQNTLVVYIGDHGADLIRGKRTCYEGGVRIPLIVRWPGRATPGLVREELVSTVDLLPTFLAAAQAEPIERFPGRSLVPLMRDLPVAWRTHLFTEYHVHSAHDYYPQRTVRDERFKLICNLLPDQVNPGYDYTIGKHYSKEQIEAALAEAPGEVRAAYALMRRPPEFELYDLQSDPYEFCNLSTDPGHEGKLESLKQRLLAWRRETNDPFLDPANVLRLQREIEATKKGGKYVKRDGPWEYLDYMSPTPNPSRR
ncbi:MAG: sulfatase [Candidatus Hydrogenedentes bacterium]|nr:sulfatase [Candidatus Hydrogenedentota bacterium]